jgi:hypothetical protein
MADLWLTPVGGTPEDYGRLIREEMDKWRKVIRAAGIKARSETTDELPA